MANANSTPVSKNQGAAACIKALQKAHKIERMLFWDKANHAAMCQNCHNSYKQRLEKSGRVVGCDVNGYPIDPRHHWRTG